DPGRGDAGPAQQRVGGLGEGDGDARVELAELVQRTGLAALSEGDQGRAQVGVPGEGAAGEQAAAAAVGVAQLDQRGVDAVGAGARDQPEEEGWHAGRIPMWERRLRRDRGKARRHGGSHRRGASAAPTGWGQAFFEGLPVSALAKITSSTWRICASALLVWARNSASTLPRSGSGGGMVTASGLRCTPLTRNS